MWGSVLLQVLPIHYWLVTHVSIFLCDSKVRYKANNIQTGVWMTKPGFELSEFPLNSMLHHYILQPQDGIFPRKYSGGRSLPQHQWELLLGKTTSHTWVSGVQSWLTFRSHSLPTCTLKSSRSCQKCLDPWNLDPAWVHTEFQELLASAWYSPDCLWHLGMDQ